MDSWFFCAYLAPNMEDMSLFGAKLTIYFHYHSPKGFGIGAIHDILKAVNNSYGIVANYEVDG